tara:strand:- start:4096 stop:4284 length:189 start_codon:yes stop_codon:yes gene_type:complete
MEKVKQHAAYLGIIDDLIVELMDYGEETKNLKWILSNYIGINENSDNFIKSKIKEWDDDGKN